jgi:hypothetical protein
MSLSFVGVGVQSAQVLPGIIVPGGIGWGWVGRGDDCGAWCSPVSSAVSSSHLAGGNDAVVFSAARLSTGKGFRMLQCVILIYALSSACWEKKEKRKKWSGRDFFPQDWRPDMPCYLREAWVLPLLGAIKDWFKGQSLHFFLHFMWWWLLFWLGAMRITHVRLKCLKEVLEITERRRYDSLSWPPFLVSSGLVLV